MVLAKITLNIEKNLSEDNILKETFQNCFLNKWRVSNHLQSFCISSDFTVLLSRSTSKGMDGIEWH